MEQILIVEDILETQQGLRKTLQMIYPKWIIATASTVQEAKDKIQEGIDQEQRYHVCILDYKLPPKRIGENPAGSLELTDYVLEKLPECLVIQITAFLDDEEFKGKRIKPMLAAPNTRLRFVAKDGHDEWPEEVGRIALKRVLGDPINELIAEIFGEESLPNAIGRRARSTAIRGKSGSLTQSLAALQYEIGRSWPYLPQDFKEQIKEKIKVDESSNPVKIAMFAPETATKP